MNNPMRNTTISLVLAVLFCLAAAGQANYDFGITPFFKNYPEFKRGLDPYANFSGTLQERVDNYSGKLTLTFPLPGIPWSATTSFAPVLLYNSNIWSYRSVPRVWRSAGASKIEDRLLENNPAEAERWFVKVPTFYENDSFLRFSEIGRPHNMPGWALPMGGVYTEISEGGGAISSTGLEDKPDCLIPVVEKKYFVDPGGASHMLVEMETASRPFFSSHPVLGAGMPSTLCSRECVVGAQGQTAIYCLPERYAAGGAARVWHAVDGSLYYYVESQAVPNENHGTVYAKDGTAYELAADGTGRIARMTDPAGNVIEVLTGTATVTGSTTRTCAITLDGGGSYSVALGTAAGNPTIPGEGSYRAVIYQNTAGTKLHILYTEMDLPTGAPAPIHISLLRHVLEPKTGGGTVCWKFENGLLGAAPVTYGDILVNPVYQNSHNSMPIDLTDEVFSDPVYVTGSGESNHQIYMLTGIMLPGGYQYGFGYHPSAKLKQITYPDGGYREYQYGNWPEPSTYSSEDPVGATGKYPGESPFGGVALVYREDGSGKALERAYLYMGYNDAAEVETVCWTGDGGVQVNNFFKSEIMDTGWQITQFGFSGWKTGKQTKSRSYGLAPKTGTALDTLKAYCLRMLGTVVTFAEAKAFITGTPAAPLLREEETQYQNYDAGWHWTVPGAFCNPGGSGCYEFPSSANIAAWYAGVIPPDPDDWTDENSPFSSMIIPEWNTQVTRKIERIWEGGSTAVEKTTGYTWGNIACPGGTEYYVQLQQEQESTGGAVQRTRLHEYYHYWPVSAGSGLPARMLGLAKREELQNASAVKVQESIQVYSPANPAGATSRMQLFPVQQQTWLSGTNYAVTGFSYETAAGGAVRPSAVYGYEAGGSQLVLTTGFIYDAASGLLKEVIGAPADGSPVLYMLLDFDPATGQLLRRTDRNGDDNQNEIIDITAGSGDDFIEFEYDAVNRLSKVWLAQQGTKQQLAGMAYTPAGQPWAVTTTSWLDATKTKVSKVQNDPMGRAAFSWTSLGLEGGELQYAFSRKFFDIMGRTQYESWPEKKTNLTDSSVNDERSTEYQYDGAGRVVKVRKPGPSGSLTEVNTAYSVSGTRTLELITDERSNRRWLYRDALGRLMRVDEDPPSGAAWITGYSYDAADRLTWVNKRKTDGANGQIRQFWYDGGSRLLWAQLPEYNNKVMHYTYDNRGNLTAKKLRETTGATSPELGANEAMTYDAWGRLTGRTIAFNGTTSYEFKYDAATGVPAAPSGFTYGNYLHGRPVYDKVTHSDGTGIERWFNYEWRGLASRKAERLGATGNDFQTVFNSYDRAGNLLQLTYPSLQQVNQDYQNGGSLTATRFAGVNIFSGLVYEAHGAVSAALLGNSGLGQSNWVQEFNSANWPARLLAGPGVAAGMDPEDDGEVLFDLDYTGYDNTGNITAVMRHQRPSYGQALTQHGAAYGYDKLNRLTSSSFTRTGGLNGQYTYTMDAWGNLTAQTKAGGSASGVPGTRAMPVADANADGVPDTNRLSGKTYDVLGNQTGLDDPLGGAFTAVYLDQGHIAKLMDGASTEWRYYYDADGMRRIKAAGSTGLANSSFTFYAGNDLICQLDRGSQVQDNEAYTPKFLLTDHLGTTRAELTFDASKTPQILKTYDYMPYGEEIAPAPSITEQVKFTGKQRDTESGLDFFGARYYNNSLCRFISVDLIAGVNKRKQDPQRINLYSYVRNNPIKFVDLDGLDIAVIENGPTGSNPIGHTAIAITNRGVISFGNSTKFGSSMSDYVEREAPRRNTTIYIIKTTPEQDALAYQKALQLQKKGPLGGVLSDNCSTRSNEILDAAGVPKAAPTIHPDGPTATPASTLVPGDAGDRARELPKDQVTTVTIPQGTTAVPPALKQFDPPPPTPPPPPKQENKEKQPEQGK